MIASIQDGLKQRFGRSSSHSVHNARISATYNKVIANNQIGTTVITRIDQRLQAMSRNNIVRISECQIGASRNVQPRIPSGGNASVYLADVNNPPIRHRISPAYFGGVIGRSIVDNDNLEINKRLTD
ncbi:hypothetical protein TI01_0981 [Lysobacter sp. A03]|nr:hypothetical protein TI01_0981 [Lysobacter sp. A03]